jgi:hypothetical protein
MKDSELNCGKDSLHLFCSQFLFTLTFLLLLFSRLLYNCKAGMKYFNYSVNIIVYYFCVWHVMMRSSEHNNTILFLELMGFSYHQILDVCNVALAWPTKEAHSSVVGWGTTLQAWRSWVWFPMTLFDFSNLSNPSSCTMALGSTQPLTEMSSRKNSGGLRAVGM